MANQSKVTKDHDEIKSWAEERGGKPAHVAGTGSKGDIGILRIEFPGATASNDANLEELSWDRFFEKFDEQGLALLYQEETAGGEKSNFNKLVSSETADQAESEHPTQSRQGHSARNSRRGGVRKSPAKKAAVAEKASAVNKTELKKATPAKKTTGRKAVAKKTVAKKKVAKKAAKKAAAKKSASRKAAPASKKTSRAARPVKKVSAKRAAATKKATKKAAVKRAPAKRSSGRGRR